MLFGSRQERFVAATFKAQSVQGTLNLNADVIEACKITETIKVTHQQSRAEIMTQRKEHPDRMKLPEHLRRKVIILEPGKYVTGLRKIGYEITEVLEHLPPVNCYRVRIQT